MNVESFFKITYGLYVVTSEHEGKKAGYAANTAFQVTSSPAQFAISCHKDNFSAEIIAKSGFFAFSILQKDASAEIIGRFGYQSTKNADKFQGLNYKTSSNGIPILLQDCIAWFECKVVQTVDVGSHLLFIGELIDSEMINSKLDPLTYAHYHEVRKGLSPKNAPTYIEESLIETKPAKGAGKRYKCAVCGYVYDEAIGDHKHGIDEGTAFEDLPEDWTCPACGVEKEDFYEL